MTTTCDCRRDDLSTLSCSAVHLLWCAYHDWRGAEGYELCARLGVPVVRMKSSKPFHALLYPDKFSKGGARILLPPPVPGDMSAREGLLIYHELGHLVLRREHPFFRHKTRWVSTKLDVQEEAWCDAFAAAMLLAFFGWEPFSRIRQGHAYLRYGEKIGRPRNDILLAYRLRREMRRPRKKGGHPPKPLYLLSKGLLANADSHAE